MTEYEILLQQAFDNDIKVIDNVSFETEGLKGLALKEGIVLSRTLITEKEKKCVLAEEIAHKEINYGDITDLRIESNAKQELKAHKRAVYELVPFSKLIDVIVNLRDDASLFTIAEALDITEEFLLDVLYIYKCKYSPRVDIGSYIVFFDPFRVVEKCQYYNG